MTLHPDWIVPQWPVPANVHALVTTRAGGVSKGPYASFNLGVSTGDEPAAVTHNRALLRSVLPQEPIWLRQMHGSTVIDADSATVRPEADASVSCSEGVVCAILVADCIPVLLTDRAGSIIAAAHAGWRGLASGVVDRTVDAMRTRAGRDVELTAYLGPGIGRTAFEVGPDVVQAFTSQDVDAMRAFIARGERKWLCDLFWLARRALGRAGVQEVYGDGLCTYSNAERFYSYRRDRTTGRMAALIWRTGTPKA